MGYQKLIIKSSNLVDGSGNPVLPAPSELEQGEIALNYHEGVETLSTKNTSGEVVTFVNRVVMEQMMDDYKSTIEDLMNPRDYLKLQLVGNDYITTQVGWYSLNSAFSFEYKKNNEAWQTVQAESGETFNISLSKGDVIKFRGDNTTYYSNNVGHFVFSGPANAKVKVSGNIMSLVNSRTFNKDNVNTLGDNAFYGLFKDFTSLYDASELVLPSDTLSTGCYCEMFRGCTSLTTTPILTASNLASSCYSGMFKYCTSLVNAPILSETTLANSCYKEMFKGCTSLTNVQQVLPATELAENCYNSMFYDCTSLTDTPQLPASSLTTGCYASMFKGCTSLVDAPDIPAKTAATNSCSNMFDGCSSLVNGPRKLAKTLAANCYSQMFRYCSNLENAPILPAETLAENCYLQMFDGCTKLAKIRSQAYDISASGCTENWVRGVAATGVFLKHYYMSGWTIDSNNGIPSGWTSEIDYELTPLTFVVTKADSSIYFLNADIVDDGEVNINNGGWFRLYNLYDHSVSEGDNVQIRGNGFPTYSSNGKSLFGHNIDAYEFNACGNIMSLMDKEDFLEAELRTEPYHEAYLNFENFFEARTPIKVIDASNLFLSCNNLVEGCYRNMFSGCTKLTKAPKYLPATNLAKSCYEGMFEGCTAMTTVPESIPATEIRANNCCLNMFKNCYSITTTPVICATSLTGSYCCKNMYLNCSSITTTQEMLSATTLANDCYESMYSGCKNLLRAPILPDYVDAGTSTYHFDNMFNGCNSLSYVKCLSQGTNIYRTSWLYNVSPTGTFIKADDATWSSGSNGIPTGWTVRNESDPEPIVFTTATPLTFVVTSPGTIYMSNNSNYEYSKNGGSWSTALSTLSVDSGDTIQFRGNVIRYNQASFSGTTCGFTIGGNINSMYNTNFTGVTTLSISGCFENMFRACTGLTDASEAFLPATTLVESCYNSMFKDCTSLTTAPEILATASARYGLGSMFEGCTSLSRIKCMITDFTAGGMDNWVRYVAASGTFIKDSSATWDTGNSGIPTGWTVQNA